MSERNAESAAENASRGQRAVILPLMEYQVPQFIEVEDRIVGPLTLRQFVYLAGAAGLCIVFFFYLPTIFAFIFSAPVAAFGVALAFYKVNGKPFVEVLEAAFNYYTGAKLLLWRHEDPALRAPEPPKPSDTFAAAPEPLGTPRLTRGKLSELAWSLDVKKGPSANEVES